MVVDPTPAAVITPTASTVAIPAFPVENRTVGLAIVLPCSFRTVTVSAWVAVTLVSVTGEGVAAIELARLDTTTLPESETLPEVPTTYVVPLPTEVAAPVEMLTDTMLGAREIHCSGAPTITSPRAFRTVATKAAVRPSEGSVSSAGLTTIAAGGVGTGGL